MAEERDFEYKMELQKMNLRVQNQPTLFERQSQVRFLVNYVYFSDACR